MIVTISESSQWAKSPKKNSLSAFSFIWHSKYSAILSKIHSYTPTRLLIRRFCPLGWWLRNPQNKTQNNLKVFTKWKKTLQFHQKKS